MSIQEIQRQQAEAMPREDLKAYAGQWVALRDGHVIARDLDGVALRGKPEVREDDLLMLVPDPDVDVLILFNRAIRSAPVLESVRNR